MKVFNGIFHTSHVLTKNVQSWTVISLSNYISYTGDSCIDTFEWVHKHRKSKYLPANDICVFRFRETPISSKRGSYQRSRSLFPAICLAVSLFFLSSLAKRQTETEYKTTEKSWLSFIRVDFWFYISLLCGSLSLLFSVVDSRAQWDKVWKYANQCVANQQPQLA